MDYVEFNGNYKIKSVSKVNYFKLGAYFCDRFDFILDLNL